MSNIFLYVLIFSISLVHSNFLNYFWFDFVALVNWNFEFTKSIFFNVFSSLVILFFIIEKFINREKIKIYHPKIITLIVIISLISTIFSYSPFISLFWNQEKAHSLLLVLNLIWLFIVLSNKNKEKLEKLIKVYFYSVVIVSLLWIKEYYYPSLNYANTQNNAISSLWNNQYLALSLVIVIPLIIEKYKWTYHLFLVPILLCLFLTKSFFWIFLVLFYFIYKIFWSKNLFILRLKFLLDSLSEAKKCILKICLILVIFFVFFIIILNYFPEKVHSFLSRFYIWQNVLKESFGSLKSFFLWNWFESLAFIFPKEKNHYLYVFENFWYFADRSHNMFVDILFSTWIFWLILSVYVSFNLLKISYKTKYFCILILFFIFVLFNFASISHYIFLIIIIALLSTKNWNHKEIKELYIFTIFAIFSIISIVNSTKFYLWEIQVKSNNFDKAVSFFSYPLYYIEIWNYEKWLNYFKFPPIKFYQNIITKEPYSTWPNCAELVKNYNIAENYFWCARLLELIWKNSESLVYYRIWLSLLPDLWNENSLYYKNYIIKKTISKNRFFSKKYSSLKDILEKVQD